jgi:hypothetical protein
VAMACTVSSRSGPKSSLCGTRAKRRIRATRSRWWSAYCPASAGSGLVGGASTTGTYAECNARVPSFFLSTTACGHQFRSACPMGGGTLGSWRGLSRLVPPQASGPQIIARAGSADST